MVNYHYSNFSLCDRLYSGLIIPHRSKIIISVDQAPTRAAESQAPQVKWQQKRS